MQTRFNPFQRPSLIPQPALKAKQATIAPAMAKCSESPKDVFFAGRTKGSGDTDQSSSQKLDKGDKAGRKVERTSQPSEKKRPTKAQRTLKAQQTLAEQQALAEQQLREKWLEQIERQEAENVEMQRQIIAKNQNAEMNQQAQDQRNQW